MHCANILRTRMIRDKYGKPFDMEGHKRDEDRREITKYQPQLRGPTQNRFGGYQTLRMRSFRGSTFGAAGRGRRLSPEERRKTVEEMKLAGRLPLDTVCR